MLRRRVVTVILGAALLGMLAACVQDFGIENDKRGVVGVDLTPEQARLAMIAAEDAAIATFGGEWEDGDSFLPSACEIAAAEGVYFSGHRTRIDDAGDLDATAEQISSAWEEAGYETDSGSYADTHRIVTATAADGLQLTYTANEVEGSVRAGLIADSACVPADFAEVRREYGERLKEQGQTEEETASP